MLLGGVCSKSTFSNYFFFLQEEFFETNLDLSKHPQQVFWIFFSFTKYLFSIFVFIRVIGELREQCAKFWNFGVNIHGEIICQSRLLLNPFYSGPIVHCMEISKACCLLGSLFPLPSELPFTPHCCSCRQKVFLPAD